jgi:alpha-galactosidase
MKPVRTEPSDPNVKFLLKLSDEDIYGDMAALNAFAPDANMIQIDGRRWTERGDYTRVRPDLPGGIKAIVDRIHREGKTAGLHFDGFRGDDAAEICRTHPEYFLHDQNGELIVENHPLVDRDMNYTFFDYSHPGARAYIAECVRTMKEEWGITYFKVDFMRYGLEQDLKKNNPSGTRIQAHDPTLTGLERFRLGMQTLRDAIGMDNYFIGCSAGFGPCLGFVDGMRTVGDAHLRFKALPERVLANGGNYYLDGKVFNGDADYLVFREAADEDEKVVRARYKFGGSVTLNEGQMWADFNKLYGKCRLQSDNLMTLRDGRKAIVRDVFDHPAMDETFSLDVWKVATDDSDAFELILSRSGEDIYLGVFNWGGSPKTYALSGYGLDAPVHLAGPHSKILKYEGTQTFAQLRESLQP